ncbi:efflux RND transporter periplasmic adaptor subunit [Agrobacterium sp. CNPSo 3708]|uniref:efflux RND transporter periplasmic adaptor subunit n=1 Tax=Agrobacterium sp. CNPSo 3708 TaxID=3028150 RepID=UPI002363277E|nr:efflux RND transporter periplasmic adaptor subunit [Agrobacterium sp. CNPSo 3708]MDD1499448.1 efflux RND transporter periplasmic adaptor subunit [Agrobacterium sp. CNPSo 3708]
MKFLPRVKRPTVTTISAGLIGVALLYFTALSPNAEEDTDRPELVGPPIMAAARGVVDIPGGLLRVTSPRDGSVASLFVHEGDQVRAGDILATLDSEQESLAAKIAAEEAVQAQEQYKLLQMKMKNLSRQADRVKRAAAGNAVSDQALDDAISARDSLGSELKVAASILAASQMRRDMAIREVEIRTIRAPVDGFIVRQGIKVGEFATASGATEMFTILPEGQKIIRAEIPEQFLDSVKPGLPVEVLAEDRSGQSYEGRISRVSPVLMQSTGTPGERNDIRTATSTVLVSRDAPFRVGQRVIIRVYE